MNTPKKQPVRVVEKKYTREELATKAHELTTELAVVKAALATSEENRKYAWDRVHWAEARRNNQERKIHELRDEHHACRMTINKHESEIRSLTRRNLILNILGWAAAGSIFALLGILLCR